MRSNLERLTVVLSLGYLVYFLYIALSRFTTPFELEWMEGGMIAHALRLREGLPIYAPPSLDFVPFFYTPGYPTFLYLLDMIGLDLSFWQARAVSLASTIGTFSLIFYTVQRESKSLSLATLGVGFYAAFFRTSGAFYDLARPDAMMIFLVTSTLCTVYYSQRTRSVICAAILMSLAFFTKQTAAVFFPIMAGWLLWHKTREGLIFTLLTFSLCTIGVMSLDQQTDGAFWSYIFEGHQGHIFYWKNILLKYWRDLIFLAPLTLLLPILWFSRYNPYRSITWILAIHWSVAFIQRASTLDYPPHMYYRELFYESPRWLILIPPLILTLFLVKSRQWSRPFRIAHLSPYWLWIYIAGVGASGLNHSTQWAYSNCFMLVGLAFSVTAPLMLHDLINPAEHIAVDQPHCETISLHQPKQTSKWLWYMVIAQLIFWLYLPNQQLTHEEDHLAWVELNKRLESYSAPIFFPAHPTYNALQRQQVGLQATHTHQMGIRDVAYRGGVSDLKSTLVPNNGQFRWSAVVTHEQIQIPHLDRGYYEANRWRYNSPHSLKAKTGFLTRPQSLWLPRMPEVPPQVINVEEQSISLNFESTPSSSPHASWDSYGWKKIGDAFGVKPFCRQRWRGEGRCGVNSGGDSYNHKWTGRLETTIPLNPHQHLSLLVKAKTRLQSRRAQLEIKLLNAQAQVIANARVWSDNRWKRINLIPKKGQILSQQSLVKLQLLDHDTKSLLMIDDIKIDTPLDLKH